MARSISIRHSLFGSLFLIILLLSGTIMATTFIGSKHAIRMLSSSMITHSINLVESKLQRFFYPVIRELQSAKSWGKSGLLDVDKADEMNRHLRTMSGTDWNMFWEPISS